MRAVWRPQVSRWLWPASLDGRPQGCVSSAPTASPHRRQRRLESGTDGMRRRGRRPPPHLHPCPTPHGGRGASLPLGDSLLAARLGAETIGTVFARGCFTGQALGNYERH
jgi:hypothetical protein